MSRILAESIAARSARMREVLALRDKRKGAIVNVSREIVQDNALKMLHALMTIAEAPARVDRAWMRAIAQRTLKEMQE